MADWITPAKFKIGDIITSSFTATPKLLEVIGYKDNGYVIKHSATLKDFDFTWNQIDTEYFCKLEKGEMAKREFKKELSALLLEGEDTDEN